MRDMQHTFEAELTDFLVMFILLNPYYFNHNVKSMPKNEAPIMRLDTCECRKLIRKTFERVKNRYVVISKPKNRSMIPMLIMWYIILKESDFVIRDITSKNHIPKFTVYLIQRKWNEREYVIRKFLNRNDVKLWIKNKKGFIKVPKWKN